MSNLVSIATGNLTDAATWGLCDATGSLVSTNTGSTALTTSYQDSAAFTPGAITVAGIALRLASRASGSPSNTITVNLRNSTGGIDVKTVVANVSDLPVATAGVNSEGGWHYFKFDAPVLILAATNYIIQVKLSSTSTAVSICTNGTTANWQRLCVTSTTQAPAAGDDMHICQTLDGATNPATQGSITVTMDSTANTDYGSANTNTYISALGISKGGTLTWGTTAATNYLLRLSGHLIIYRSGTYSQGTTGTPIPRGSTAQLEFDCAADNDFKIRVLNGATMNAQGLSRTSGKDVVWTLLTANQSASATTATVADDTGWLSGDEIGIASTTRTPGQAEAVTLSVDAGASTLTHGAVTNAHAGSTAETCQAEVILLTRNVIIRSVSTSAMFGGIEIGAATVDFDWVLLRYVSGPDVFGQYAVDVEATSGTVSFSYCCLRDTEQGGWRVGYTVTNGVTFTLDHSVGFNIGSGGYYCFLLMYSNDGAATITVNDNVVVAKVGSTPFYFPTLSKVTVTNIRSSSSVGAGVVFGYTGDLAGATLGPFVVHSHTGVGLHWAGDKLTNFSVAGISSWRNTDWGWRNLCAFINARFLGTTLLFGNGNDINVRFENTLMGVHFSDVRCYGSTSFASTYGFVVYPNVYMFDVRIESGDFGTASGLFVAHTTADVFIDAGSNVDIVLNNANLASATEISMSASVGPATRVRLQRRDRTATQHVTKTKRGDITYETTTVDVSPSVKLAPNCASPMKFDSAAGLRGKGILIPVASGATKTPAVKVRKNSSYAGSAPRFILKANPSIGVTVDTVLDTLSVGADTWETLSGTTPAATDDGVFECVVDCDGTAGAVFVDTASV
jgi:uncharacterized protein (DUF2237 family)